MKSAVNIIIRNIVQILEITLMTILTMLREMMFYIAMNGAVKNIKPIVTVLAMRMEATMDTDMVNLYMLKTPTQRSVVQAKTVANQTKLTSNT